MLTINFVKIQMLHGWARGSVGRHVSSDNIDMKDTTDVEASSEVVDKMTYAEALSKNNMKDEKQSKNHEIKNERKVSFFNNKPK